MAESTSHAGLGIGNGAIGVVFVVESEHVACAGSDVRHRWLGMEAVRVVGM